MPKTIHEMTHDELVRAVRKFDGLLAQMEELLPGLLRLPQADKRATDGRINGADEEVAFRSILETMGAAPEVFGGLAARDGGKDPTAFEVAPLADAFEKAALLAQLAERFAPFAQKVGDTALALGEEVLPVLRAGYQVGKNVAPFNPAVKSTLQPALDYWARLGQLAAQAREAAKKAAAEPK
jgi:hypothetical protein